MFSSKFLQRILALVTATSLLMATFLLPLSVSASPPAQPQASVDSRVLEQLAAQGKTTFWVILREKADLRPAYTMRNWEARGRFVFQRLQAVANSSQAGIRSLLQNRGAAHRPFWIANAIQVTADTATLRELQARPEVAQIVADGALQIPEPLPGIQQPGVQSVEWGIDRIGAPQVWSTFGVRGEGIVIANIDTGVQFDHPALVAQYRGNLGGGNFDHNYNWFDPSNVCGFPSLVPCDNAGHGTHTMGTMAGDDGNPGLNQIGVAPNARWIAAKGCEDFSCSFSALLASGQWILAPTDLNGQNPRADLRPHIVNNSWGGGPGDSFYEAIVDAWIASGIFPQFSNGNAGPSCNTSGSPGDYPQSYSAGAFDIFDNIADFSSRGSSAFDGETKPNIAAPGVDVRSSVPGNSYDFFSGTSMASPHVAGTVALMWSAAPTIIGDVAATRVLLDQTAFDVDDQTCGGSASDNNVWGEGRLDAFAAVDQSPRGPTGTLQGTVTDANTNLPINSVTIHVVGPTDRTTFTDDFGNYSFPVLPIGTYDVSTAAFGYLSQTANGVAINENATTDQPFALTPLPSHTVTGTVNDGLGNPISNATITILGTPIPPAITDANGFYSFASVPEGEYDVHATAGGCNDPQTQHLVVVGSETLDFTLPQHSDAFGYTCQIVPFNFIDANNDLGLFGDDDATQVNLPFPFTFYGQTYNTAYVSTNGFLNFEEFNASLGGGPIPDFIAPNSAIYPFWDDLYVDFGAASVRTELLGTAPNRQFVIEWRDVAFCCISAERVRFEIVLFENGHILMQYTGIDANGREQGDSATVGIENETSSIALQYSFNQPVISDGLAVRYILPPSGFVEGYVTDAVDNLPLSGVTVQGLQGGNPVRTTASDGNGFYRMMLPVGVYDLEASLANYATESVPIDILLDQTITQNFSLGSARAQVAPAELEFFLPAGQTRTKTLTLSNIGQADLTFTISELTVASLANANVIPPGVDTQTAAADYQPLIAASVLTGGPVLVFMDAFPWGLDSLQQVLNANGIPFDLVDSSQMGTIDMSQYEVVFLSSDQPQDFYGNYNGNLTRFEDYVQNGGFLWVGAAAWGFNGGDFNGGQLPGGATVVGPVFEDLNDVLDPTHPTMQGVPNPFSGTSASHAAFENLPAGTNVIASGQSSGLPTLIEYEFGAGRVLAFGQTMEFGFQFGQDAGRILENSVPYAYAFEAVSDIPWISEDPTSGVVPAGTTQEIQVTVDTTGLAPGLYRSRLLIRTNDPTNPSTQIPVTLIVPAYLQGVNAGGKVYTDLAGDSWAADKLYTAGSWGYIGTSSTFSTKKPISGTDDDRLYQDQRQRMLEYRFDNLPSGVYQVDLRFAELARTNPGRHLFDVLVEGNLVLPAHDIASEVGSFAADDHVFYVVVTDGQLNVRFIARTGFGQPIINALRVTHRPDR
jgi:hypothetical protein